MKRIIITAIISALLTLSACKKCYRCSNECGTQVSTGHLICSDQFSSDEEWWHFTDSLSTDLYFGSTGHITFSKKVCNEDEMKEYEGKPGIGCTLIND